MHGGAFLKAFKAMAVVAVVLFASSIVRADDTRINNNGGGSPGDPQCGLDVPTAQGDGFYQYNCNATAATGTITTFSFEVLDANTTGGGLTCLSNLTGIGWTGPSGSVHNPGGVDVCTFTAPTSVSTATIKFLKSIGDPYTGPLTGTGKSDGDCDLDDFVLGIVVNCGVHNNNGNPTSFSPFVGGAPTGFAVNGGSLPSLLPEPSSMSLVLIGIAGLPLVRRKFSR
jgi:hypothetical protein